MPMKKGNKEKKVYFSPSEWRKVCKKAELAGCRVGTYIRQISVEGEVRVFDLSLIAQLQTEINRIETNINQIALTVNSLKAFCKGDLAKLKEEVENLKKDMNRIIADITNQCEQKRR